MRQQKEVTTLEGFTSSLLCLALAAGVLLTLDWIGHLLDLGDWSETATSLGLVVVSLVLVWTWLRVRHVAEQIKVLATRIKHLEQFNSDIGGKSC